MKLNPQETADLVTFTEEILNGKLHFLCSDLCITHSLVKIHTGIILVCTASFGKPPTYNVSRLFTDVLPILEFLLINSPSIVSSPKII